MLGVKGYDVEIQGWSGRSPSQRPDSLEVKIKFTEPLGEMRFQKRHKLGRGGHRPSGDSVGAAEVTTGVRDGVGEEQTSGNLEVAGLAAQGCSCWENLQDALDPGSGAGMERQLRRQRGL